MTSKSTSMMSALVIWEMITVDTATIVAPQATTDRATRCTSEGMRRPKTSTDWRPFASDQTAMASTARVVTLMTPAVDAEPPPTNMSMQTTSMEEPFRSDISITLNPPERVIAERKNAWNVVSAASIEPKVRGLSYSSSSSTAAPAKNSNTVVTSVSFVCNDQRFTCQTCLARV